jgi:hypothetical protein
MGGEGSVRWSSRTTAGRSPMPPAPSGRTVRNGGSALRSIPGSSRVVYQIGQRKLSAFSQMFGKLHSMYSLIVISQRPGHIGNAADQERRAVRRCRRPKVGVIPIRVESDTRPSQHRHGRRKPAPSEGWGPAIHVFRCCDRRRRGWPACADHDAEGQAGESTSTRLGIMSILHASEVFALTRAFRVQAPVTRTYIAQNPLERRRRERHQGGATHSSNP